MRDIWRFKRLLKLDLNWALPKNRHMRLIWLLSLVIALVVGYVSISLFSTGEVLGLGRSSYISPNGLVNQDPSKPTSFGDADDLSQIGPSVPGLAPGTSIVSGHITDASTGLPVANANVGIGLGTRGSGATYTTTAADGSYSFSGLANGTYNLASSRYTISGAQPLYAYSTRMGIVVNANTTVDFTLNPITVAGSRPNQCNRATNFILIDYDETYFESWFTDLNSMVNNSPAIHSLAQGGVNATENWTTYGWSPIDHYQLAVGSYPAWRSPDAPGPVWGQPDGLDTNIWYNTSEHFLQESIFDVAKSYGMSTAVIGGSDYPTGHITDANVDLIQLGSNPSGIPYIWATEVENFITAHASNPNGFLVYLPATMAEGRTVESTSPDALNGAYQTASSQDDQAMLSLLNWLQANGYMANTVVAATGDEAENDHTSYDNFYGLGSTGLGTTRHVPWTLKGPGIVSGPITYTTVMNMDDVPTNIMASLNLPAPVDSRGHLIPDFFQPLNCGPGGTPTPSRTATQTPTPTITNTGTAMSTNTPTNTYTPTPTPVTVILVGHIVPEGRPAPPDPRWSLPVSVNLVGSTGSSFDYDTATDESGYFTVTLGLVPGAYTWRVKNPQTLANSGSVTLAEGYNSAEMGTLQEGDANNDNCVNVQDAAILKNTFGKALGDPGYDPRADFNGDNVVSTTDYNLLKRNFGECGAPGLVTPTPAPTFTPTSSPTNTPTQIPTNTPVGAQHIVISEFRVRGPSGGNDEFIELYNPTSAPIAIGGWKINGSNNAGTVLTRLTVNAGTSIPPHAHFLATNSNTNGYSGSVPGNQTYSTGVTDDGGIAVLDANNVIVDEVGMSAGSAYGEGTRLASLGTSNLDRSYERKPGGSAGSGQDTGDNSADFQVISPSEPQNLSSPPVP